MTGKELRNFRIEAEMKRFDVAKRLGISTQQLGNLESGATPISDELAGTILEMFAEANVTSKSEEDF